MSSFPLLVVRGVSASAEDLRLSIPDPTTETASLRIEVLDSLGTYSETATLLVWHVELDTRGAWVIPQDLGEFEAHRILPGTIQVSLEYPNRPGRHLGEFKVKAGETLDLGLQSL